MHHGGQGWRSCDVLRVFPACHSNVNCVRFHPDGTVAAACSSDNTVKLWDIRSNTLLHHYAAHTDSVNEISFHPSGNYLLSSSSDMPLKVRRVMAPPHRAP